MKRRAAKSSYLCLWYGGKSDYIRIGTTTGEDDSRLLFKCLLNAFGSFRVAYNHCNFHQGFWRHENVQCDLKT